MLREFREFLFKQNALALAVGVIIGAATGKVVESIVRDLLMPVIGLAMPGGDWRAASFVLSETVGPDGQPIVTSINYGAFIGVLIDFAIVAFVIFMILRTFVKAEPSAPTKTCMFCGETIPLSATRCRACTSPVG
jgi:large conductance mechanosensitive channel